jgi:hypothetical protein
MTDPGSQVTLSRTRFDSPCSGKLAVHVRFTAKTTRLQHTTLPGGDATCRTGHRGYFFRGEIFPFHSESLQKRQITKLYLLGHKKRLVRAGKLDLNVDKFQLAETEGGPCYLRWRMPKAADISGATFPTSPGNLASRAAFPAHAGQGRDHPEGNLHFCFRSREHNAR